MDTLKTKDVTATVKLNYSVPKGASETEIQNSIHSDLCRLLDSDSTTGTACWAVTVEEVKQ